MNTLIIAGGFSSRMGRDKARILRPNGVCQMDHVVGLARMVCDEVWVSTRHPEHLPTELPVIADLRPGMGPLAALEAANAFDDGPWLVVGCDLFLLDESTLRHLMDHRDPSRMATAFRNRLDGRAEPLCAIYEPEGLSRVAASLDQGRRGARGFLESLEPGLLDLPNPVALDSANTPIELAECFEKLSCGVRRKSVEVSIAEEWLEPRPVETMACTLGGLLGEIQFRDFLRIDWSDTEPCVDGKPSTWDARVTDGSRIGFRRRSA